jgi:hypothetical protein
MACVTKFIDGIGLDLFLCEISHGTVAVRALHQPFFKRMTGLPVRLRPDIPVTVKTEIRFTGLQILIASVMSRMTLIAGNIQ